MASDPVEVWLRIPPLITQGLYEEAIEQLSEGLNDHPNDMNLLSSRAGAYLHQGQALLALQDARTMLVTSPIDKRGMYAMEQAMALLSDVESGVSGARAKGDSGLGLPHREREIHDPSTGSELTLGGERADVTEERVAERERETHPYMKRSHYPHPDPRLFLSLAGEGEDFSDTTLSLTQSATERETETNGEVIVSEPDAVETTERKVSLPPLQALTEDGDTGLETGSAERERETELAERERETPTRCPDGALCSDLSVSHRESAIHPARSVSSDPFAHALSGCEGVPPTDGACVCAHGSACPLLRQHLAATESATDTDTPLPPALSAHLESYIHLPRPVCTLGPLCPLLLPDPDCDTLETHLWEHSHDGILDVRPRCKDGLACAARAEVSHVSAFCHPPVQMPLSRYQSHNIDYRANLAFVREQVPRHGNAEIQGLIESLLPTHRLSPEKLELVLATGYFLSLKSLNRVWDPVFLSELAATHPIVMTFLPEHQNIVSEYLAAVTLLSAARNYGEVRDEYFLRERLAKRAASSLLDHAVIEELEEVCARIVAAANRITSFDTGFIGFHLDKVAGTDNTLFAILGPNSGRHYGEVTITFRPSTLHHPDTYVHFTAATRYISSSRPNLPGRPHITLPGIGSRRAPFDQARIEYYHRSRLSLAEPGTSEVLADDLVSLLGDREHAPSLESARRALETLDSHSVIEAHLPPTLGLGHIQGIQMSEDAYRQISSAGRALLQALPRGTVTIMPRMSWSTPFLTLPPGQQCRLGYDISLSRTPVRIPSRLNLDTAEDTPTYVHFSCYGECLMEVTGDVPSAGVTVCLRSGSVRVLPCSLAEAREGEIRAPSECTLPSVDALRFRSYIVCLSKYGLRVARSDSFATVAEPITFRTESWMSHPPSQVSFASLKGAATVKGCVIGDSPAIGEAPVTALEGVNTDIPNAAPVTIPRHRRVPPVMRVPVRGGRFHAEVETHRLEEFVARNADKEAEGTSNRSVVGTSILFTAVDVGGEGVGLTSAIMLSHTEMLCCPIPHEPLSLASLAPRAVNVADGEEEGVVRCQADLATWECLREGGHVEQTPYFCSTPLTQHTLCGHRLYSLYVHQRTQFAFCEVDTGEWQDIPWTGPLLKKATGRYPEFEQHLTSVGDTLLLVGSPTPSVESVDLLTDSADATPTAMSLTCHMYDTDAGVWEEPATLALSSMCVSEYTTWHHSSVVVGGTLHVFVWTDRSFSRSGMPFDTLWERYDPERQEAAEHEPVPPTQTEAPTSWRLPVIHLTYTPGLAPRAEELSLPPGVSIPRRDTSAFVHGTRVLFSDDKDMATVFDTVSGEWARVKTDLGAGRRVGSVVTQRPDGVVLSPHRSSGISMGTEPYSETFHIVAGELDARDAFPHPELRWAEGIDKIGG
ncbi:hypothetical protein KIPB_002386 [Kipferlia bialata]|uniref:Uncharacterized protein n=1 Tax=Kipferlia bialata TaxID=797122 RepID=A0A9K3CQJ3_9EUKA|nr:hypothetical protein KIPB_002386 [Kipferlia bialata]|eukprot:g2386.t1